MDNNRKNQETTTSFGEVMKNAGVQTQPQHVKRMPEDSRLMIRIRQITRLPEKVSPPDRGGES